VNELEKAKKNRQLWHMLSIILCVILLLHKILFYAIGYMLWTEEEGGFIFITGLFGWILMIGLTLYYGAIHKKFDDYEEEELLARDENARTMGNIAAVASLNTGSYVSKDNDAYIYGMLNGIHRGGRMWGGSAALLAIMGIILNIFDTFLYFPEESNLILVLITISFFLFEALFAITTNNWSIENTFIATGNRPKYPRRVYIVYIICFLIGCIPYFLLLNI